MRSANLTVNLVGRWDRKLSQQAFERDMGPTLRQVPGARVQFGSSGGGGGSSLLTIALVGDDPDVLEPAAAKVEREMRNISGLSNVVSSASLVRPEILVTPRADVAALQGVSTQDISQVARVATLGDADQLLAKFNLGDRQVPIRVMLKEDARSDLGVLENLRVPTASGATVPLSAVADITFGAGPNQINRLDRLRVANITAELTGLTLSQATEAVNALPSIKTLPQGVSQQPSGDAESFQELGAGFAFAIITGILLMYVVLVLLFKSFFHPITILAALPVSFGGAFFLLLVTGKSLSMPALIGIIMLTGIFYGAMYGGSTTSILVNIPGEAASVVTCIDGYKMARKGRAGPALGIAAFLIIDLMDPVGLHPAGSEGLDLGIKVSTRLRRRREGHGEVFRRGCKRGRTGN